KHSARKQRWRVALSIRQLHLRRARNHFQPFPTIRRRSDLSQLPVTFIQSQPKYCLNLGADFRTLRTIRPDLKSNSTARQRPAAHCLNSFARLFLTEIGARSDRTGDREYDDRYKPQMNADKR